MNWDKSKVIMLPSNEKAAIVQESFLGNKRLILGRTLNIGDIGYHLYFTSNEVIKEGDWCVNANNTIVRYWQLYRDKKTLRKIIGSTHKSLGLPEPSKEFLDVYIKAYNEGKKIEEVLVKYHDYGEEGWSGDDINGEPVWLEDFKIYVKPDNTITIKKVKDSWKKENKEEVIELLKFFIEDTRGDKKWVDADDEWVERNL